MIYVQDLQRELYGASPVQFVAEHFGTSITATRVKIQSIAYG